MVSTPLKNISQNGNLPKIGMKIKNVWNHHPGYKLGFWVTPTAMAWKNWVIQLWAKRPVVNCWKLGGSYGHRDFSNPKKTRSGPSFNHSSVAGCYGAGKVAALIFGTPTVHIYWDLRPIIEFVDRSFVAKADALKEKSLSWNAIFKRSSLSTQKLEKLQ